MIDLRLGDCRDLLKTVSDASIDAIITDPPYPEIAREYGRMTEAEWHELMRVVVAESRRVLKPSGSAVFILQPNYERIGKTRLWLWEFVVWAGREWNLIEDVYWWNNAAVPNAGCDRRNGLLRRSVKTCVWIGFEDCYRDQDAVLWSESESNKARRLEARAATVKLPSGTRFDVHRTCSTAVERGGVTPFNLIPIASNRTTNIAGPHGHPAGTPPPLTDWWTRYICPPGGMILDPFMGSGTTGLSAIKYGCDYIGIEKMAEYHAIAERRIAAAQAEYPLLAACR